MVVGLEQKIDSDVEVSSDGSLQIAQRFVTYGQEGFEFNVIF